MANKKSSFHMGNEFSGYGDVTYLKGSERRTYMPLSQENVHLTRDFSSIVSKALGGISIFNRVVVTKDAQTGEYSFVVHIAPSNGLTNGAYLQAMSKQSTGTAIPGMIQAGWEEQKNQKWKYINSKGKYVCSDWVDYKENRYYMDSSGYMVTGWKKIGTKKWYYFKSSIDTAGHERGGQMALGWREIGELWYYLETSSGYMMTGWQTIGGKKYYLKKENEAVSKNDFGYMMTGWREIGNKWYYFYEQGDMAVSKWIDGNGDGSGYWVGEDGVWVDGSKKDPIIFEDGEEQSISGKDVWIQCETRGATDFYVKTSSSAQIQIYKDKMFSDIELYSVTGTLLEKTLSNSAINNNNNTYFIHVKSNSQVTIKCKVNMHIDIYSYNKGALWTPNKTSAIYYTQTSEMKWWYVDSIRVSYLVTLVNHSDFLDFQSALVNGGIAVALLHMGGLESKLSEKVIKKVLSFTVGVSGILTALVAPANFKGLVLSEIDEAAGYNGNDSQGMPIYERGVCLRETVGDGLTFYDVFPWEGPEMEGPKGYTGKWEKNKNLEEE